MNKNEKLCVGLLVALLVGYLGWNASLEFLFM